MQHGGGSRFGPPPFFSAPLAQDVRRTLARATGATALGLLFLVWVALLTWSPGPGQAGGMRAIGTAFGPAGPLLAGSLVHLFGLAAPLALLGPMLWGYALLRSGSANATAGKVAGWALALLSGTMTASLLPRPQGWLLAHGLGGVLGDAFLEAAAMLCGASPAVLLVLPAALLLTAAGALQMLYGWHGAVAIAALCFRGIGVPRRSRSHRRSERIEPDLPGGHNHGRTSPPGPCGEPADLDEEGDGVEPVDAETAARERAFARRFAPQLRRSPTIGRTLGALALRVAKPFARDEEPEQWRAQDAGGAAIANPAPRSDEPAPDGGCAGRLAELLSQYGVPCAVCALDAGPLFAAFELAPCRGAGVDRVLALRNVIAQDLGVAAVRMTVQPQRARLRLEMPSPPPPSVPLAQLLTSPIFLANAARLPLALGTTAAGAPLFADLALLPHVLVAGRPGSGRTTLLRSIVTTLAARHTPASCRLILVDSREAGLAEFETLAHLARPVAGEPEVALAALDWVAREVGERQKWLAMAGVQSIDAFNGRVARAGQRGGALERTVQTGFDPETGAARYERLPVAVEFLPRLVVVVAEAADLVSALSRLTAALARVGGAVGIHLVLGSALPRGSGVIEALAPLVRARAVFKLDSVLDSRALLGDTGAECLFGRGDMLWTPNGGPPVRLQGLAY